jgi:hypothetical protein
MFQFNLSVLEILMACMRSGMPASPAAKLVNQLMDSRELNEELWTAREQAYNGLNADCGDYVKAVQIAFLQNN